MKTGELNRYHCNECMIAFDIATVPMAQRPDGGGGNTDENEDVELMCCPFCMSTEIKPLKVETIWTDDPG